MLNRAGICRRSELLIYSRIRCFAVADIYASHDLGRFHPESQVQRRNRWRLALIGIARPA